MEQGFIILLSLGATVIPALNKAHQYAAGGRRTPFSLRLRLHYKGAVVRWR